MGAQMPGAVPPGGGSGGLGMGWYVHNVGVPAPTRR